MNPTGWAQQSKTVDEEKSQNGPYTIHALTGRVNDFEGKVWS